MKEAMLQRKVAAMSGKLDAGAQLLKAMTDGGNDPETDVSTDDVTGDDEASIERDIGQYAEALRQLDNRHGQKSMTKASRKDDETLGRAAGSRMAHGTPSSRRVIGKSTIVEPPELGCITAHRVVKHRSLEYQVQRENQGVGVHNIQSNSRLADSSFSTDLALGIDDERRRLGPRDSRILVQRRADSSHAALPAASLG